MGGEEKGRAYCDEKLALMQRTFVVLGRPPKGETFGIGLIIVAYGQHLTFGYDHPNL